MSEQPTHRVHLEEEPVVQDREEPEVVGLTQADAMALFLRLDALRFDAIELRATYLTDWTYTPGSQDRPKFRTYYVEAKVEGNEQMEAAMSLAREFDVEVAPNASRLRFSRPTD